MQIVQIDINCCKCEFPAEGLVLKIERYAQRLTQGYNAFGRLLVKGSCPKIEFIRAVSE